MDLGSLLVILAVFVIAAAFIARPLVEGHGSEIGPEERRISALKAERDQVLDSILEIEMDQAMGKLSPEDFQAQRGLMVGRGAALLKELAGLEDRGPAPSGSGLDGAGNVAAWAERELEAEVMRLRRAGASTSEGFCGQCGEPVRAGDRFCTHCGASLVTEQINA
ncbi:MAG: hypothetical protein A2Z37_07040 [Chloroflexi bacterium RBG_19FT_COMBO_62_14]|nr:MAG: hypothetical protein A2Z37_07040 [Chloroflexi bacterium RBG_19FT_COMBO_62_14]